MMHALRGIGGVGILCFGVGGMWCWYLYDYLCHFYLYLIRFLFSAHCKTLRLFKQSPPTRGTDMPEKQIQGYLVRRTKPNPIEEQPLPLSILSSNPLPLLFPPPDPHPITRPHPLSHLLLSNIIPSSSLLHLQTSILRTTPISTTAIQVPPPLTPLLHIRIPHPRPSF